MPKLSTIRGALTAILRGALAGLMVCALGLAGLNLLAAMGGAGVVRQAAFVVFFGLTPLAILLGAFRPPIRMSV